MKSSNKSSKNSNIFYLSKGNFDCRLATKVLKGYIFNNK